MKFSSGVVGRPRKNQPDLNVSRRKQIARIYRKGLTSHQLGKLYGISHTRILQILKLEGVKPRSPGRRTNKLEHKAKAMFICLRKELDS